MRPEPRAWVTRILLLAALLAAGGGWGGSVPSAEAADFRKALPYYTGHLAAKQGAEYGFQVTFFRSGLAEARAHPSRWAARNLYLAHFAVSDLARREHRYFERVGRAALGQAGASDEDLRVWIGNWGVTGDGMRQRLSAKEGEFTLNLALISQKEPVVHGERGISRKGAGRGHASHYYSLTRLSAEGTLAVRGEVLDVAGQAWMDHEFGSTQLAAGQVGWDWFGLQLDDGTELMLYLIRRQDGSADPHSAGTFVAADGRSVGLARREVAVQVLDHWQSPRSRGRYPSRWRIGVPSLGLDLTLAPVFPDQELDTAKSTQVTYWEGAVRAEGRRQGRRVTAKGYVELTGYAGPFRQKL